MRLISLIILTVSLHLNGAVIKVGKNENVKSLTEAVRKSNEGDTILLMPGTHEVVSPDGINFPRLKSGTVLQGADRHKVILKPKEDNPTHEALIKIVKSEKIVIKDITFYAPQGSLMIENSEDITIENCIFKGFRWNAKRRLSVEVKNGGTFSGSTGIVMKHLLFHSWVCFSD